MLVYNRGVNRDSATIGASRLGRAALGLMILYVVSRALGLLRDVVISQQFGTSRELDAYFAAFTIPDFLFNLIAGGALGSAFLPLFAGILAERDQARAWQLARGVINLTFVVIAVSASILAIFAPEVARLTVARGFAPADQALTAALMRAMLITPIVFGVSGIVMSIHNSFQHFVLPALAPVVYNLAIIAGALLLAPAFGVYGLAAGVIAGAFLHLLIQIPWLFNLGWRVSDFGFALDPRKIIRSWQTPDVRRVFALMLPRAFGIAAVQINFIINTILASTLPAGRIAALGYAWRVMLLPVGVVGQSVGTAIFPTLAAQGALDQSHAFRQTFSSALRGTLFLSVPASVGLMVLGAPLVAVLFQRGEFNSESTAQTTFALQFYAFGLFAHSGLEIITRAFFALQDTLTPVVVGIGAMIVNIALSLALMPTLAQGGLALANSAATILEVVFLFFILRRRIGDIDGRRIARSIARIVLATVAMSAALAWLIGIAADRGALFIAATGAGIGAAVYVGVSAVLRSEELATTLNAIRNR
ncbi:MAG: murein biosynthesis integral membrane protein MurJ [Chloroflexi bacterium]|nr:murein biosynthesis integral membrane protein MurJ [Chloroflexota bacterium]